MGLAFKILLIIFKPHIHIYMSLTTILPYRFAFDKRTCMKR